MVIENLKFDNDIVSSFAFSHDFFARLVANSNLCFSRSASPVRLPLSISPCPYTPVFSYFLVGLNVSSLLFLCAFPLAYFMNSSWVTSFPRELYCGIF